jgi:serine/threonine-protein kinase HipA
LVLNRIANADDHLRDHGFPLEEKGWRLSPAYDLNPSPDPRGLAIDEHDTSLDFGLALSVAKHFRLAEKEAQATFDAIQAVVATWRERARAHGIARSEIAAMDGAIRSGRGPGRIPLV